MKRQLVRLAIGVSEGCITLSAIGGGIVMLAGTYKDGVLVEAGGGAQFPLEWLHNTPFSDYTVPRPPWRLEGEAVRSALLC